jgi:hypothetical protein
MSVPKTGTHMGQKGYKRDKKSDKQMAFDLSFLSFHGLQRPEK